jgi:hypothetical protein
MGGDISLEREKWWGFFMGWVLKGSWQKLVVCRYEEDPARGVSLPILLTRNLMGKGALLHQNSKKNQRNVFILKITLVSYVLFEVSSMAYRIWRICLLFHITLELTHNTLN